MKNVILLSLAVLSLAACKKEAKIAPKVVAPAVAPTAIVPAVLPDTIPDAAIFKIKMVKDSTNYDETMFMFNHTASLDCTPNDAPYFAGFGEESIASISRDGKDLAINGLPYTSGMNVALDVNAKDNGSYSLQLSYINHIPANVKIYLKDNMTKDSVDVRTGNYNFSVNKSDTTSFGTKRFKLIIKDGGVQQTVVNTNGPN